MARLQCTPKFISEALFPHANCTIVGAGFDLVRGVVVLDLVGTDIPEDAEEITATFHSERVRVTFQKSG